MARQLYACALRILCIASALSLAVVSLADEPLEWPFYVRTLGADASWTSPTPLPTDWTAYALRYEMTEVRAKILEVPESWAHVEDEMPDDLLTNSVAESGPLPITLFDDQFEYPEPPEPAGFGAHITIRVDTDGWVHVSLTDVLLDTVTVEILPGVPVEVELFGIDVRGIVTAKPTEAIIAETDTLYVAEDGTATLTIRLSGPPGGEIEIVTEVDEDDEDADEDLAIEAGASLTFNDSNWDDPREIRFAAGDDNDDTNGSAEFICESDGFGTARWVVWEVETDCDENGIPDDREMSDGTAVDCDGNGVPDVCDPDADGDGVSDACEECPDDADKVLPGACGCGVADMDTDGDGVLDCVDDCPDTPSGALIAPNGCAIDDCNDNGIPDADELAGGAVEDCDGNGVPDECDADVDGDGVPDVCDNCPNAANADQADADDDGVGDACASVDSAASDASLDAPGDEPDPNSLDPSAFVETMHTVPNCGAPAGSCAAGSAGWLVLTFAGVGGLRLRRWR